MTNTIEYAEILYLDLQAVSKTDMARASYAKNTWVKVANKVQQTPLAASEFRLACASYPIVFTSKSPTIPVALMSLTPGKNPFVSNDTWQPHVYAPLSLRRYPFLLDTKDDQNILAIDTDVLEDNQQNGYRLFTDTGENSEPLNNIIELCQHYDQQMKITAQLCQCIEQLGLFTEKQITITATDGTQRQTGLFRMIDTDKYQQLDDASILELHRSQALWLIHAHMISMDRIKKVASLS